MGLELCIDIILKYKFSKVWNSMNIVNIMELNFSWFLDILYGAYISNKT